MVETTIVICPKVVSKVENSTYHGLFLKYYLKRRNMKAIMPNEAWGALKFRIHLLYSERFDEEIAKEKAQENVATLREWLSPENEILNRFGKDIIKGADCSYSMLTEITKNLVDRKWAVIKFFISEDDGAFSGMKVQPITLFDFFNECLKSDVHSIDRIIVQDFVKNYPDWEKE